MITVWGEGRGFRVVWLLEEMGLPYRLRRGGPAGRRRERPGVPGHQPRRLHPGDHRRRRHHGRVDRDHGVPDGPLRADAAGAGPAAIPRSRPTSSSCTSAKPAWRRPIYFVNGARNLAPEAERENWSAGQALEMYQTRLRLVPRQLARSPYMAGEAFTAADISVTYAMRAGAQGRPHPARRGGARLRRPHQQPRRLQARDGHLRGHQGLDSPGGRRGLSAPAYGPKTNTRRPRS